MPENTEQKEMALTGGSGHLGYIVHSLLSRKGVAHRLLLRNPVDYIGHSEIVTGSLEESSARRKLVQNCRVLIHCAGMVWPKTGRNRQVHHVNFELTKHLYEDAAEAGVEHLVFISSIHSMVVPDEPVFDEGAALVETPNSAYDYSKAESERFLDAQQRSGSGPTVTILSPTAIIGPGDPYLRGMNQLFHRLYHNRLPALTSGGFDIVDVRDVAFGIAEAALRRQQGKYILSGQYYTIREMAERFASICGLKVTRRVLGPRTMRWVAALSAPIDRLGAKPLPMNKYAVDTLLEGHRNISSAAARRDLNYSVRSLDDTFSDLKQWFSEGELIL